MVAFQGSLARMNDQGHATMFKNNTYSHVGQENLKIEFLNFLENAPSNWYSLTLICRDPNRPVKKIALLGEEVTCSAWEGRHFITGTDIVKVVSIRYKLDGHELPDKKKFEEGIFSDLRNLKPGVHAVLEKPHSKFLDFLYLHNCVRTHKKQKVFYWECVPHEKLYQESLKRSEKRAIDPVKQSLQYLTPSKLNKDEILRIKTILDEKLRDIDAEEGEVENLESPISRPYIPPISIDNSAYGINSIRSSQHKTLPRIETASLPSIKSILNGLNDGSRAKRPCISPATRNIVPFSNEARITPSNNTGVVLPSFTNLKFKP